MSVDIERLKDRFKKKFGQEPVWAARAPGRVNLIGEHIDYNGGLVAPVAIDREVAMLAAPTVDRRFELDSVTFNEGFSWDVGAPPSEPVPEGWPNYFLAVLDELRKRGIEPDPMRVLVDGDIPIGGGLSSSAAFEVCAAHLILASVGAHLPDKEIAQLAQAAENGAWVGMQCGIMDQFISACAVAGHALLLDCQRLEAEPVPIDSNRVSILIVHSTVERELVRSAYNERRAQCEEGLRFLNAKLGRNERFLLAYSREEAEPFWEQLPAVIAKRLRHVFTEQERTLRFKESLLAGDFENAGELMKASHASLRDDYEVSCMELDTLAEVADATKGVFGCRMTGGGFGGCVVALTLPNLAEGLGDFIATEVGKRVGKKPWTLFTGSFAGGGPIPT